MDWFSRVTSTVTNLLPDSVTKDLQEFVSTVKNDTNSLLQASIEPSNAATQTTVDSDQSAEPLASAEEVPASAAIATGNGVNAEVQGNQTSRSKLAAVEKAVAQPDDLPGWDDEDDAPAAVVAGPTTMGAQDGVAAGPGAVEAASGDTPATGSQIDGAGSSGTDG